MAAVWRPFFIYMSDALLSSCQQIESDATTSSSLTCTTVRTNIYLNGDISYSGTFVCAMLNVYRDFEGNIGINGGTIIITNSDSTTSVAFPYGSQDSKCRITCKINSSSISISISREFSFTVSAAIFTI